MNISTGEQVSAGDRLWLTSEEEFFYETTMCVSLWYLVSSDVQYNNPASITIYQVLLSENGGLKQRYFIQTFF